MKTSESVLASMEPAASTSASLTPHASKLASNAPPARFGSTGAQTLLGPSAQISFSTTAPNSRGRRVFGSFEMAMSCSLLAQSISLRTCPPPAPAPACSFKPTWCRMPETITGTRVYARRKSSCKNGWTQYRSWPMVLNLSLSAVISTAVSTTFRVSGGAAVWRASGQSTTCGAGWCASCSDLRLSPPSPELRFDVGFSAHASTFSFLQCRKWKSTLFFRSAIGCSRSMRFWKARFAQASTRGF
mmetsp:Transcript_26180/g.65955  ORF Transcript_26180/g.65955 Transcript_26180/m.65955 type:complete len:244 (+) Transcript_26180:1548-2279(+)